MAADHAVQFPGAVLEESTSTIQYVSATGEPFGSNGEFDVPFRSENGHVRQVTFRNAKVAMPIVSTHGWNAQGFRTITDEEFGSTIHIFRR